MPNEIIVVGTSPGREEWVNNCIKTIDRPYIVVSTWGYELGKIKWVLENTNLDRFVFLQDSVEIIDNSIFDIIWDTPGTICLHHRDNNNHIACYLGVYEREILQKIDIPLISTKQEAVNGEGAWVDQYLGQVENITCFGQGQYGEIVNKFGRENLIYRTAYLTKYRGDWSQRTITGSDPDNPKWK